MAKATRAVSSKKTILPPASLDFLKKYLNTPSPVGFESGGQKIWLQYLKPYIDSYFTDAYGTAVGVINPEAKFRVVIEAHADEISWFVNYINPEGLMYLKRNGGVDHQVAPGQRVIIHGTKGPVKAVSGGPPFIPGWATRMPRKFIQRWTIFSSTAVHATGKTSRHSVFIQDLWLPIRTVLMNWLMIP